MSPGWMHGNTYSSLKCVTVGQALMLKPGSFRKLSASFFYFHFLTIDTVGLPIQVVFVHVYEICHLFLSCIYRYFVLCFSLAFHIFCCTTFFCIFQLYLVHWHFSDSLELLVLFSLWQTVPFSVLLSFIQLSYNDRWAVIFFLPGFGFCPLEISREQLLCFAEQVCIILEELRI